MTLAAIEPAAQPRRDGGVSLTGAFVSRSALLLIVIAAIVAGLLATGDDAAGAAVHEAGADLARLLRAMAALKAMMAAAMLGAILWRLGTAISAARFALYGSACAAMAAGPGLIWGMEHVRLGALLLHGGLLAAGLLLWRDPAVASRLAAIVVARRARLAAADLVRIGARTGRT